MHPHQRKLMKIDRRDPIERRKNPGDPSRILDIFAKGLSPKETEAEILSLFRKPSVERLIREARREQLSDKQIAQRVAETFERYANRLVLGMIDATNEARYTDTLLPGLLNDAGFELQCRIMLGIRQPRFYVVIVFDLDKFKVANDTHGHAAGDEVLRNVRRILVRQAFEDDIIARLHGDEFAVFSILTDEDNMVENIVGICRRIRQGIDSDACSSGGIRVTATLGAAICSGDTDIELGTRQADEAMYAGKEIGRNCTTLYGFGLIEPVAKRTVGQSGAHLPKGASQ